MEQSLSHRKRRRQRGFTLIEVLVAVFILAFGLLAAAALLAQMALTSNQSRYMSTESLLASEKLEDLNTYPASDARVAAGGGVDLTVAGVSGYFDQIQVSAGAAAASSGDIVETTTGTDPTTGAAFYTVIKHRPDGTASSQKITGTPPAATPDMVVFDRRWQVEQDTPIAGVRRITVVISLHNPMKGGQAIFQMSMVRP